MKVNNTQNIPIKMWLDDIEEGALDQAKNIANLPFAFKHIAIMPDSHQGYGMPIGGVMATTNVIVPNAVGVDIGCGMCAVKTSLTEIDTDALKKIWDLENISFSHLECNRVHSGGRRIDYPKGQKWCKFCKQFKKIDLFPECAKKDRGVVCTECNTIRMVDYRKNLNN